MSRSIAYGLAGSLIGAVIFGFAVSTAELSEQEMAALRNYRVEYSYWSVKPAHFHIAETDR